MRTLMVTFLAALPALAHATNYSVDPSMVYRAVLGRLGPGDTVTFAPGRYTRGFPVNNVNGTAAQPILIAGPMSGARAIIEGRSCCNTISIRSSSHVHIRSFDLDGQGLAVDAVKAESDGVRVHDLTLEDLHIYGHDANQQIVGISSKCPAWNWTIRANLIEETGTGIYLGNSDGNDPFIRGVIEYNVVLDPIGYAMQIKHQNRRPALSGIPAGSNTTIIRHNVFSKQNNASSGGSSRPVLLLGHWPRSGAGQNDRYEVYGNLLFENPSGQSLLQAEGNVALYDNVLINTRGDAVIFQAHNDAPRQVAIYHNTIRAQGTGIGVYQVARGFTPEVVANAVFARDPIDNQQGVNRSNVTDAYGRAGDHVVSAGNTLAQMDLHPRQGRLTGAAVDLSSFAAHTDTDVDFDRNQRNGRFRGAYVTGAGWGLSRSFQPRPADPPDAGVPPDAGETLDAGTSPDANAPPRPDARPVGDASIPPPLDAGAPAPMDAGVSPSDARPTPRADGGRTGDASAPRRDRATQGGCRCVTSEDPAPSAGLWGALFVGLLAGTRRRRVNAGRSPGPRRR